VTFSLLSGLVSWYRIDSLQLALDASEILLAGPVGFWPDVTHSFPNMSIEHWLVLYGSGSGYMEGHYLTWMISNPSFTSWGRSFTLHEG
jgi:hypothetical protein